MARTRSSAAGPRAGRPRRRGASTGSEGLYTEVRRRRSQAALRAEAGAATAGGSGDWSHRELVPAAPELSVTFPSGDDTDDAPSPRRGVVPLSPGEGEAWSKKAESDSEDDHGADAGDAAPPWGLSPSTSAMRSRHTLVRRAARAGGAPARRHRCGDTRPTCDVSASPRGIVRRCSPETGPRRGTLPQEGQHVAATACALPASRSHSTPQYADTRHP